MILHLVGGPFEGQKIKWHATPPLNVDRAVMSMKDYDSEKESEVRRRGGFRKKMPPPTNKLARYRLDDARTLTYVFSEYI